MLDQATSPQLVPKHENTPTPSLPEVEAPSPKIGGSQLPRDGPEALLIPWAEDSSSTASQGSNPWPTGYGTQTCKVERSEFKSRY